MTKGQFCAAINVRKFWLDLSSTASRKGLFQKVDFSKKKQILRRLKTKSKVNKASISELSMHQFKSLANKLLPVHRDMHTASPQNQSHYTTKPAAHNNYQYSFAFSTCSHSETWDLSCRDTHYWDYQYAACSLLRCHLLLLRLPLLRSWDYLVPVWSCCE